MHYFCLHHKDRPDRKKQLLKIFDHEGLKVEWVEDFHPQDINIEDLNLQHDLNINAISVYLKHQKCYELQKEKGYQNILIFNFSAALKELINI